MGQLKHEIRRKALVITPDLLVEAFRRQTVERGEIPVEDHLVAAQDDDHPLDALQGNELSLHQRTPLTLLNRPRLGKVAGVIWPAYSSRAASSFGPQVRSAESGTVHA